MTGRRIAIMQVGDRFRVKATTYTRKSGILCHNRINTADCYLMAGDVGTVERRDWTAHNGDQCYGFWLVFDRGRDMALRGGSGTDLTFPDFYRHEEYFSKVKPCP